MSESIERLLQQALALPPHQRTAFVEEACRGNAGLRDEVVSLLAEAAAAETFFDRLSGAVFDSSLSSASGRGAPVVDAPDLRAGEVVGHYRITSLIGRGGMGSVYRARDMRLDRDVALKFLPSALGAEPDAEARALREARAAAALEHPNVCNIHDIGDAGGGRLFIAMAYYQGETLRERLGRGSVPVEEASRITVQIVRGLSAAHSHGIVHRDVKPGNIHLGMDGTVRLLDFGLAVAANAPLAGLGMTPGTIAYMSPEQIRGEALDARTDLWSLGVVMYEMLAGVRPFYGTNAPTLAKAILHQKPEPLSRRRPDIPAMARIVDRLLRKAPAERYEDAGALLRDLEGEAPSKAIGRGARWATARRTALLVGGVLLFAVAVSILGPGRLWDTPRSALGALGEGQPTIAVLPFLDVGPDSSDAYLAAGMTEELIATLARAGNVRVIASSSLSGFRGRETDLRLIGDSLRVSNVLRGDVQRVGSRLHVRVRLAARDGSTRWSQTYDREFTDVLAVQEEVARAVAGELGLRFDRERQLGRHRTRNINAYELYLRASDPLLARSESGVLKAQEYFEQAVAADPTYAAAHAGLALMYVRRARTSSEPGMPITRLLRLAENSAARAVALDDSLAEAHYALGRVREATLEFGLAEASLRRAVALDPLRSIYHRSLAYLHAWGWRPREELEEARRGLEADPLNPYAHIALAGALFANRRYDDALSQLHQIAAIQPPLQGAAFTEAQCYWKKEMRQEAIALLRPRAEGGEPLFVALLGYMLAQSGQQLEARQLLAGLLDRHARSGDGTFHVAVVYAGLGDLDAAFSWLDRSIDDRSIGSVIMANTFEDLHRDPRFDQLRRRLGLQ